MLIQKIHEFILDTLFPIHCLACKKEGTWLCQSCQARVKIKDEHLCGVCEKMITPDGRVCLFCKTRRQTTENFLDAFLVASSYAQFPIANAIHLFKYRFVTDLHLPLGDLLISVLNKTELPLPDVIMPVPLHKKRLRWRGFNQSALLAKHLTNHLLPQNIFSFEENILIRTRHTLPQMKIKNHQSRKQNISGAFALSPGTDIKNKTILLVDDVATTGSTIFECAKILKNSGAREVFAIVIARQETKR